MTQLLNYSRLQYYRHRLILVIVLHITIKIVFIIANVGGNWEKLSPCSIDGSSNMKKFPAEHIEKLQKIPSSKRILLGYNHCSLFVTF